MGHEPFRFDLIVEVSEAESAEYTPLLTETRLLHPESVIKTH